MRSISAILKDDSAHFGDIVGSVIGHFNKVSCNLLAGREPCLQFVKHGTSLKCNKV